MKTLKLASRMMATSKFGPVAASIYKAKNTLEINDAKDYVQILAMTDDYQIHLLRFTRKEEEPYYYMDTRYVNLCPGTGDSIQINALCTNISTLFHNTACKWLINRQTEVHVHDEDGFEIMAYTDHYPKWRARMHQRDNGYYGSHYPELAWDISICGMSKPVDDMAASVISLITLADYPYTVRHIYNHGALLSNITEHSRYRSVTSRELLEAIVEIEDWLDKDLHYTECENLPYELIKIMLELTRATKAVDDKHKGFFYDEEEP